MLKVLDDTIADIEAKKKKVSSIGRKLNISLVFISQPYFKVSKTERLNMTHYFIMKIPNKRELQQIGSSHFSDIELKDFMKLYKHYTKKQFYFFSERYNFTIK